MTVVAGIPGFTILDRLNLTDELRFKGERVLTEALRTEVVLRAQSTAANQQPTTTNSPITIEFGPAQDLDALSLAVTGEITFKQPGTYIFDTLFQFGRTGAAGESILFGRSVLNTTPTAGGIYARLDDADVVIPGTDRDSVDVAENDVLKFELYRDSSGNNSGGLFAQVASLAGWDDVPTARIVISRVVSGLM